MSETKQYCRTHRAIQNAFLSLLSQKPFEKITVQDILDQTPVSRATFYKHFHDKYEIAEQIQDEILRARKELRDSLAQVHPGDMGLLVENFTARYRDMSQQMLNVCTEQVNLPQALDLGSRAYYLESAQSPNRELEARIYGAAISSLLVAMLESRDTLPLEQTREIMLPVALQLLGLPDDPDVTKVVMEKYAQNR